MGAAGSILATHRFIAAERFYLAASEQLGARPELEYLVGPIITPIKEGTIEAKALLLSDEELRSGRLLLVLKLFVDNLKLADLPVVDDDELMPVELSQLDLVDAAVTSLKATQGKVRDYSIIVENAGLEDLSFLLNVLGSECPPPLLLRHLNATGNNIMALAPDTFAMHPCINYIQLGGNPFQNFSPLAAALPSTMVALDLSFTEGLVLEPGCFLLCPQLLRLSLDGCELPCTTHDGEGDPTTRSMFYGLVQLTMLSLKENDFVSTSSLDGLQFFALSMGMDEIKPFVPQTLEYLHLEDNPVSDSQLSLRDAKSALMATIQSLKYINNEPTTRHLVSSFDVVSTAVARKKRDSWDAPSAGDMLFSGGNKEGLDAMEKEYISALKGERDVSVVA